jgi:hypothetical protein
MKEFMLLVRNTGDHLSTLQPEKHGEFLKACEKYIGKLKEQGKLLAAQPLVKQGVVLSGSGEEWTATPINAAAEVQVGYYHILANDMDDAIAVAKENPEFAYTSTASVEVRPIKMKEATTGYVYPKS